MKTAFQLPFTGSWFVFWGGNTKAQNHHHTDTAQRYALDLVILDKNGNSHQASGAKNEDYYAFGQAILAPADGQIIEAVDGYHDNVPQKTTNDYAYDGNHVIIKNSDDTYSLLGHLRNGSLNVQDGQQVKAGQKLGECGNSGNSSEPHLHYHLMNSDVLTVFEEDYTKKPQAKGLKPYFDLLVWKDGQSEAKLHYSPVKGDIISKS